MIVTCDQALLGYELIPLFHDSDGLVASVWPINRMGEAIAIELYVPTTMPTIIANANP